MSSSSSSSSGSSSGLGESSSSSVGDSGARKLTVTRYGQKDYVIHSDTGFRLRFVAVGENMPSEVFRFMALPVTDDNPAAVRYDGVCSPTDLEEFPVGDPAADQFPPFCRRAEVDLVFRSRTQADEWATVCLEELGRLVYSLNRQDVLVETETTVFE